MKLEGDGLGLHHNRRLCVDALDSSVGYGLNYVGLEYWFPFAFLSFAIV